MRTLLLLGVAAAATLMSQSGKAATVAAPDSDVTAQDAQRLGYVPQAGADYTPPAYRGDAGYDYSYSESYDSDGYDRDDYDPNRSYRYDRRYSDADMARMCRRDDGIGGAAIGGVAGAVAGNRIAGRGNRTAGTLIGAGVGAVAGALADKEEDRQRCSEYHRRVAYERDYRDYYDRHYSGQQHTGGGYYQGDYGHRSGHYQGSSYGYYSAPETIVTTEYVPYTTTTTTTETSYDYVYPQVRTSRVAAKKRVRAKRPAVKRPACICK